MPTYAVYVRVSSEEQRERKSIQSQLAALNQYALANGIKIKHRFADDGVTSQIPFAQRGDGSRLLQEAERGKFDTLLVFRIDRLARDTEDLLRTIRILEQHGVSVRSITEPFETSSSVGKFTLTMLGGLAQMEKDAIRDRSGVGMRRGAREGRWMGGRAPFGYRITDRRLEVNESEASLVREIFSEYLQGKTTLQIADLMNARRVPVPMGWKYGDKSARWSDSTVQKLLRREMYTGVHRWNRLKTVRREGVRVGTERTDEAEQITFTVPRIISTEDFEAAQRRLSDNLRFSPRNSKRVYILRNLVRCGKCRQKCTGGGGEYAAYFCSWRRSANGQKCDRPRIDAAEVESHVWASLIETASDPSTLTETLRHRAVFDEDKVREREKELSSALAGKATERGKVLTLLRRDVITDSEAEEQLREIEQEQNALERDLERIRNSAKVAREIDRSLETVAATLRRIKRAARGATPEQKAELIRSLVREVIVGAPDESGVVKIEIEYLEPVL